MSAFVVSPQTIVEILRWAETNQSRNDGNDSFEIPDGTVLHLNNKDELQWMANELMAENVRSVNYRYNETTPTPKVKYTFRIAMNPYAAMKQIDCLDYQSCETDDWEQTNAYAILAHIKRMIINKIIRSNVQYENAPWGM